MRVGCAFLVASDDEEILIDDDASQPLSSQDLALVRLFRSPHDLHSHFVSISVYKACEPSSPARQTVRSPLNQTSYPPAVLAESKLAFELPAEQGAFVFDQRKQADLCFNPELARQHGAFLKPAFRLGVVRGRLYPGKWLPHLPQFFFVFVCDGVDFNFFCPVVFSWSRHMASSDISIPTTYGFNFRDEPMRQPWDEMIPKIACAYTFFALRPSVRFTQHFFFFYENQGEEHATGFS